MHSIAAIAGLRGPQLAATHDHMTFDAVALAIAGIVAAIALVAVLAALRNARRDGRQRARTGAALRCQICGIDWPPVVREYGRCPACLQRTVLVAGLGLESLDPREARSIRLHHEFERFYAARERGRAA